MARLTWDALGQRFYESGVDHGVLYVKNLAGVAWPGLISVSEESTGGEARPFYIDGFKFVNISSAEQFEATISSYSNPSEFLECDGHQSIQNGLLITQQPRKSFDFSYRTKLGEGMYGSDFGYKIHLIYNCLAAPSSREYQTISDSVEALTLSWKITTRPPSLIGKKPSSHFIIDTRFTLPETLSSIEDILYGSEVEQPRMPSPNELISIFMSEE